MVFDHLRFLSTLTTEAGVYQMIDKKGQVIYIGKARNLKKRIKSYFSSRHAHSKTVALVKQIVDIKVIVTSNEKEALILESDLIKRFYPRYNVLFRDDKSYPYLYLSSHVNYPRLDFYRGRQQKKGRFFGPYPSITSVREALVLLQKIFKLRQCRDADFSHRRRPCLQYQINRCTAPCVRYISHQDYQQNVHYLVMFLEGKSDWVIHALKIKMNEASIAKNYELAAKYRDQIMSLRTLQSSQHVATNVGDIDIVVVLSKFNMICTHIMIVRLGRILGQRSYFPKVLSHNKPQEVLEAFLVHYYLQTNHTIPRRILVNLPFDSSLLEATLSDQATHQVSMSHLSRGHRSALLKMALVNARQAILTRNMTQRQILSQLEAIQDLLALTQIPNRIECFDVSHMQGEATVASCVVFGFSGFIKSDYRHFNITGISPGDDYAALYQAILRYYSRVQIEKKTLPDLLIIDGGKVQLRKARNALLALQIHDIDMLAIAKGPTRKAGFETLFLSGRQNAITFSANNIGLHLLQQIRDEAHRFAITGHRIQRDKKYQRSSLECISLIGKRKRQLLLTHFGGLQGVKTASVEDLQKVEGIGKKLANIIYSHYHGPHE